MKKQFKLIIIAVLLFGFAYGQGDRTSGINSGGVRMPSSFYEKQSVKIVGTPYVNKVFWPARVSNYNEKVLMRYNAYKDEFEFINEVNDTLVLEKSKMFDSIAFTIKKVDYKLLSYTNNEGKSVTGYLVSLFNKKDFTLYKKQSVQYNPERLAKTSYDKYSPGNFTTNKDVFYFKKNEDEIIEFPSNKKGLVKLYPEKKEAIESFIKQNKISFDNEEDLIKLVVFLTS